MAADLHLGDKRIFMPIADRFTECEQTIYTNMNKVADLRHTDEQKQAMQIVALKKLLEDKDKQITRYISSFKFIKNSWSCVILFYDICVLSLRLPPLFNLAV